jgi:hypothetical protein
VGLFSFLLALSHCRVSSPNQMIDVDVSTRSLRFLWSIARLEQAAGPHFTELFGRDQRSHGPE